MNYWILCIPREDIEHCMKIGIFGLERRHFITKVTQGDKVVCCASKGNWRVLAVGHATSDYYVDTEKVFLKSGDFPDRFNFSSEKLSTEIDLISLIDRLSFVTQLPHWRLYFRNGIAKMSKQDWELITQQMITT